VKRPTHNSDSPVPIGGPDGARLLLPEQVAGLTGLSTETLAQWRSQRRGIPYLKISHNCVRYRQSDLDAWVEARIVPVQPEPMSGRRG
jgi:predicted DNA-binding transcriptional regulator AlpA